MAKNQGISLNPYKINGSCGRLLCCLNYEDETYTKCKKGLPCVGDKIKCHGEDGVVKSVDILNRTCKVELKKNEIVEEKID